MNVFSSKQFSLIDIILTMFYVAILIDFVYILFGFNISFVIAILALVAYYYFNYLNIALVINEAKQIIDFDEEIKIPDLKEKELPKSEPLNEEEKKEDIKIDEDLVQHELKEIIIEV